MNTHRILLVALLAITCSSGRALDDQKIALAPIEFAGLKSSYSHNEKIAFTMINRSKKEFLYVQLAADAYVDGRWREWVQDVRYVATGKGIRLGEIKANASARMIWDRKKVPDVNSNAHDRRYRLAIFSGSVDRNNEFICFTSPEFVLKKKAKSDAKH